MLDDRDFPVKLAVRRLFWYEGLSTRLNVKLAAVVQRGQSRTRAATEEYTDIDVLGVGMTPGYQVLLKVADCKSVGKRIAERLFWLQGVKVLFQANTCYLVRPSEVSASSRQLATRLDIVIVSGKDLTALQEFSRESGGDSGSQHPFFDGSAYLAFEKTLASIDSRLGPLQKYRSTYYWILEPRRNLQQLVTYLSDFKQQLYADNKSHFALFLDYVWLYCFALLKTVEGVVKSSAGDVDHALKQFLFGDELGLKEREAVVRHLRELRKMLEGDQASSARDIFSVLPSYYPSLRELVTRFVRKPRAGSEALRCSEWLNLAGFAASQSPGVERISANPVAAKLLNDVASFLVEASQLHPEFSARFLQLSNETF